jgi:hypothetical protein
MDRDSVPCLWIRKTGRLPLKKVPALLRGQGIQEANLADELLGQGHLNRVSRLVEDIQA